MIAFKINPSLKYKLVRAGLQNNESNTGPHLERLGLQVQTRNTRAHTLTQGKDHPPFSKVHNRCFPVKPFHNLPMTCQSTRLVYLIKSSTLDLIQCNKCQKQTMPQNTVGIKRLATMQPLGMNFVLTDTQQRT